MGETMTLETARRKIRRHLPALREKYGVRSLKIFGSFVHGRQGKRSDIDLLVEFDENRPVTLLQFVALEREIGFLLGRKVDLVERGTLKPAIGRRVLAEAVAV